MKRLIRVCILFACIANSGCDDKKPTASQPAPAQAAVPDTGKQPAVALDPVPVIDNLADFDSLSPIAVVDSKAKNPYEKYGIEFSGNCYTCDLAAISIGKKYFDIINVCDKNDFHQEEKFTYKASETEFVVNTDKNSFVFTKIDSTPVYRLNITGDKIALKHKRISKFYTQQKSLKKFRQHDCGEFDG